MFVLDNPIRSYTWGSRTALAELLGLGSPADSPQAELWMGAHPADSSQLAGGAAPVSLLAAIQADPGAMLGAGALAAFGPRLPFLLKVLAAAEPLSLQAHPGPTQAAAGYADEEARGIPVDAPHRVYRDAGHKPELLCALTPFEGLSGFRPVPLTLELLAELAVEELADLRAMLVRQPDAAGLRAVMSQLLEGGDGNRLVPATAAACARLAGSAGEFGASYRWAHYLAQRYPGDCGVVVSLLLNLIQLTPGQAVYLPAGNLHAYLRGVGVEVMASSDNVLRGGLTDKHIDARQLLTALDTAPAAPVILPAPTGAGVWRYRTPAREFELSRCAPAGGELAVTRSGPQIVVVTEGELQLATDGAELLLRQGQSAYLTPGAGAVTVRGSGVLYRAIVPLPDGA